MPGPSLSAHIRPPWASTIPLQMARPRPDPATPLPRSSPSVRVNFLNRYGSRSEGMPLPSSATETATTTHSVIRSYLGRRSLYYPLHLQWG